MTKGKLAAGVAISGPAGAPGAVGAKGDTGSQGAKGDTGATGAVGPTEGGAIGVAIPSSSDTPDSDGTSFTMSHAGKVWVAKQTTFDFTCAGGQVQVWLTLDGHGVPGSLLDSVPSATQEIGATLSGTTAGSVGAGTHSVAIRANCPTGALGGAMNVNNDLDWIVLAG